MLLLSQRPWRHRADVDHFIPWVRYPTALGHNVVLAHAACNNSKKDLLATEPHLSRWALRNREHGETMARAFGRRGLDHHLQSSLMIVRWAYEYAERAKTHVWAGRSRELQALGNWCAALS